VRDEFEIQDRDIPLSALHVRQETPVNPNSLGHFRLSPTTSFPQFPYPISQASEQILGHEPASWRVG
jgi:hypothetical protein